MRLSKWFVSIGVLATIGVAGGWFRAGGEIASGVAASTPESAAAPSVAAGEDLIPPSANALPVPDPLRTRPTASPEPTPSATRVSVPAPAARPPQVSALPTIDEGVHPPKYAPDLGSSPEQAGSVPAETPAPPSAATDVEGAARSGAPALNPPLSPRSLQTLVDERPDRLRRQRNARLDAYSLPRRQMPPWFASYRNAWRSQYRRQRGPGHQRHPSLMDAICPWTKPGREWSAQHSYQRQREQLDQRGFGNAYRYRPPHGSPGPGGGR